METNSEKPKRGRPWKYGPQGKAAIRAVWRNDAKTERSVLNKTYMAFGSAHIKESLGDDAMAWFHDEKNFHQGLLREIGLLSQTQPNTATEIARMVWKGEYKVSIRDLITNMRRERIGEKEPDAYDLANKIIRTVNDYWKRFPKLTPAIISKAVTIAHKQILEANE